VRFRTFFAVLILTTGTALSGADKQEEIFRVPEPEEIHEAFRQGFIDYRDYRELLEISRSEFLTREDSVYLRGFPDLLVGLSSNPLFVEEPKEESLPSVKKAEEAGWRQALLLRQYHRLKRTEDRRRLYRLRGDADDFEYYGEVECGYTNRREWNRRYLTYRYSISGKMSLSVTAGNFKERFGLGLIYGYYGHLLSASNSVDEGEKVLYPHYSGANGVRIKVGNRYRPSTIIYDTDRNGSFFSQAASLSMPVEIRKKIWRFSALYGRIKNRTRSISGIMVLGSLYGEMSIAGSEAEMELALGRDDGRWSWAAAGAWNWREDRTYLSLDAWTYDDNFPSYFCGGPSSRRSRTISVDRLEFSYSDRYRGETGLIAKSSIPVYDIFRFRTASGYAVRDFDDNRIEARVGVESRFIKSYILEIDCYWRHDDLYSESRRQRRFQLELKKLGVNSRLRLVLGHVMQDYRDRKDFLILGEYRQDYTGGRWALLCKLDGLRGERFYHNYLYVTGYNKVKLRQGIETILKYTYRYRRANPEDSYGTVRVDFNWVIE